MVTAAAHPSSAADVAVAVDPRRYGSTLTLECEQVRAYLEQHIPLETLKHAWRMMRQHEERQQQQQQQTSNTILTRSKEDESTRSTQILQFLHLSQTHLIALVQQLIEAEQMSERELNRTAIPSITTNHAAIGHHKV